MAAAGALEEERVVERMRWMRQPDRRNDGADYSMLPLAHSDRYHTTACLFSVPTYPGIKVFYYSLSCSSS